MWYGLSDILPDNEQHYFPTYLDLSSKLSINALQEVSILGLFDTTKDLKSPSFFGEVRAWNQSRAAVPLDHPPAILSLSHDY